MFELTQKILKKIEASILGLPSDKPWSWLTRHLFFPVKYMKLGFREFFRPFNFWAIFIFVLIGLLLIANSEFSFEPGVFSVLVSLIVYFSLVLMIFAVPSTYAYHGVTNDYTKIAMKIIEGEGVDSPEKIELFEENIAKIYERIGSRVSFYKWLIGALWAIYIISLNLELRILLKISDSNMLSAIFESMKHFWWVLMCATFVLLLVVCYKRASDLLIKSIEFGCVDLKFKLLE